MTIAAPVQRYVLPMAAGLGNGTSWANAGALTKLPQFIGEAGPGGFVNLGSQNGPYLNAPHVQVRRGGAASGGGAVSGNVTVRAVDASMSPSKAVLRSSRTPWTLPSDPDQVTDTRGWAVGGTIISLLAGANFLTFDGLRFEHCGAPFAVEVPVNDVTVQNTEWLNVQEFWAQDPKIAPYNLSFFNINGVGFSKPAFRFRGDVHGVLMQDVTGNSGRQDGGNFAVGVQCSETAHGFVFRRVRMGNCHQNAGLDYWNGDAFSTEHGCYDFLFDTCGGFGCTDGAFDLKGVADSNFTLINCDAEDCKDSIRMWGNGAGGSAKFVLQGFKSIEPRKRGGVGASNHIYGLNGAEIVVKAASSFKDTKPGGAIYAMQDCPGKFHVAADTIESSVRPRTSFVSGTTIDNVIP